MPDYDLQLIDTDYWKVVDTDGKTPEIVFEEVKDMVKNAVDGNDENNMNHRICYAIC